MEQLILILHVLVAVCIIGLVLIQHGKGADVGASFGSGSANTMFGSQGTTPVLVKITAILAAIFFTTSLVLGRMATNEAKTVSAAPAITAPASTKAPASADTKTTTNKMSTVPVRTAPKNTQSTVPVVPSEPKP